MHDVDGVISVLLHSCTFNSSCYMYIQLQCCISVIISLIPTALGDLPFDFVPSSSQHMAQGWRKGLATPTRYTTQRGHGHAELPLPNARIRGTVHAGRCPGGPGKREWSRAQDNSGLHKMSPQCTRAATTRIKLQANALLHCI